MGNGNPRRGLEILYRLRWLDPDFRIQLPRGIVVGRFLQTLLRAGTPKQPAGHRPHRC